VIVVDDSDGDFNDSAVVHSRQETPHLTAFSPDSSHLSRLRRPSELLLKIAFVRVSFTDRQQQDLATSDDAEIGVESGQPSAPAAN
jgi:hypothetical protein